MATPDHPDADVDARLATWRQGDCVLGEQWFLYRADPARPLTQASREGRDPDTGNTEEEVPGFAVVTQTCDLVRRCDDRPYVELAPLVVLSADEWRAASRGRRPRYAVVPRLAAELLAADLDRVMTVEKGLVATWDRVAGCRSDEDARVFALALARKRQRAAFPDDFVDLVRALQGRLIEKHDKRSEEGAALQSLREIRVRAAPEWGATQVELTLFFIREPDERDFEGIPWDKLLQGWLEKVPAKGRFIAVDGLVQTLDDLTARDYVESDPLDLGHLSDRCQP